jgi:hypothetical protein
MEELLYPPYGTEFIGPLRGGYYHIVSNGYHVPYLVAYKRQDTDTDWTVILDGRMEWDVDDNELRRFVGLIANAMAIAAGYTHFGEGSSPYNRFSTGVSVLGEADPLLEEDAAE